MDSSSATALDQRDISNDMTVISGRPDVARWLTAWPAWLSVVFYGVVTLALTWPLWRQMRTATLFFVGETQQFIWDMSWAVQALRTHANPFLTHELFAPVGAHTVIHVAMFGPSFILAPVTALFGPIAATNAWVIACLILAGFVAERLLLALGVRRVAALWGGLALAFSPVMEHRLEGQLNLIALWEPLLCALIVCLWRRTADPGRAVYTYALLWSCAFAFTLLTDYQTTVYAALATMGALLTPLPPRSRWFVPVSVLRRISVAYFGIACAPVLAVMGLIAYEMRRAHQAGFTPSANPEHAILYHTFGVNFFVDHAGFIDASPLVGGYERYAYLGIPLLLGLAVGVLGCVLPAFRPARTWLGLTLLTAILALGARFLWDPTQTADLDKATTIWWHAPALPYLAIMKLHLAPFFREPGRFSLAVVIFAAVGAAVSLDSLLTVLASRRIPVVDVMRQRGAQVAVAVLAFAGTIAGGWTQPFLTASLTPYLSDPALTTLSHAPAGTVLTLPTIRVTGDYANLGLPPDMSDLVQALTRKPTVGGYVARAPMRDLQFLSHTPSLMALQPTQRAIHLSAAQHAQLESLIHRWHIRYILIDTSRYVARQVRAVEAALYGRNGARFVTPCACTGSSGQYHLFTAS